MGFIHLVTVLLAVGHYSEGFSIRLWPTIERGTEGFVEAFYNGSWGFVGNPELRFTDATATFLCQKMGLSLIGYGSGWTSMENYSGHSWLYGLECFGNETNVNQCMGRYSLKFNNYTSLSSWSYRYGSRLYCVDTKLTDGEYDNTGIVLTAFSGKIYTICYDDFDMNAAKVVCNHLRYNGAVNYTSGDPGSIPIYFKKLNCEGEESSLTECNTASETIENCSKAVYIICRAVRLTHWNEYNDEGAVEIYHNGSWGFVGDPRFVFDDVTSMYLCKIFGFQNVGFSTYSHPLEMYDRKAWLNSLTCTGNETHIMQCDHLTFWITPSLMDTYRRGTWLHCFDFNVTSIRLVDGPTFYRGRVELQVNGRWGSICPHNMFSDRQLSAGNVVCKSLGHSGVATTRIENYTGNDGVFIWMSDIFCDGTESSIMDCSFTKGWLPHCYFEPVFLNVECIDIDECLSSPCRNKGSCENGYLSYTCQCPEKWGGTNCEIDIEYDACIGTLCLNNGTCKDLIVSFECVCTIGFDGDYCQNDINDCEISPCRNGGSCEDRVNGYKCYCVSGYAGINCQTDMDECMSQPCENNGICLDKINGYSCSCALGYMGDRCQIDIDECSSFPCVNDGICEDFVNKFECHCKENYEGNYCEKISETEGKTTLIAVLVSAITFSLLGVALFGCLCIWYRKKHKQIKSNGTSEAISEERGTTGRDQEGNTNIYNSSEDNTLETDHGEVYAEIKEGDLDDYLTPASAVGLAKDVDGYVILENDRYNVVRYHNRNDTKTDDYSKLSRHRTADDYSKCSRSETS